MQAIIIWIGEFEAIGIAQGLNHYQTPRPMTQVFMARLLQAAQATVESVTISALQDDVFYATLRIKTGKQTQAVDARPSDALALAVEMGAPIYVSEAVMRQVGQPIPAGHLPTKKGVSNILSYLEAQNQSYVEKKARHENKSDEERKRENEHERHTVLSEAFSST